jgi:hypothetical protein
LNFIETCLEVEFGGLEVDSKEIASKIILDLKKINYILYLLVNVMNAVFVILKLVPFLMKKRIMSIPGIKSLVQLIQVLGLMRIMNSIFVNRDQKI